MLDDVPAQLKRKSEYSSLDDVPAQLKTSPAKKPRAEEIAAAMTVMPAHCAFYSIEVPLSAKDVVCFNRDPHAFMNNVVKKPVRAYVSMEKLDGKQRGNMKKAQWPLVR